MLALIPVDPDADTAREWARDELSKPEYHDQGENWLARAIEWVTDFFDSLGSVGGEFGGGGVVLTIVVALAVVAFVLWLIMGPLRAVRKRKRVNSVFEDDLRTAKEIQDEAERAASAGDWNTATVEMYRVLVRSLEERDILDDRPGMTAYEAAVETSARFPGAASPMLTDADVFDGVRYGHLAATEANYRHVRATYRALEGRTLLQSAAK